MTLYDVRYDFLFDYVLQFMHLDSVRIIVYHSAHEAIILKFKFLFELSFDILVIYFPVNGDVVY